MKNYFNIILILNVVIKIVHNFFCLFVTSKVLVKLVDLYYYIIFIIILLYYIILIYLLLFYFIYYYYMYYYIIL